MLQRCGMSWWPRHTSRLWVKLGVVLQTCGTGYTLNTGPHGRSLGGLWPAL